MGTCRDATVAISGDGAGDNPSKGLEVKVPVGWTKRLVQICQGGEQIDKP